jgi:hypothetical protein
MAANFAPYQDIPETQRALSPPPVASPRLTSPRASLDRTRNIGTAALASPTAQQDQWNTSRGTERVEWSAVPSFGAPRENVDLFETGLGIRVDYEACLAYLVLPPAGPALLLVAEHQSDYVRCVHFLQYYQVEVNYFLDSMHGSPPCSSPSCL